ncbi:hypothetical protein B484DRAFT_433787, partial [Ochromonadaceae sp. CCMP2298]
EEKAEFDYPKPALSFILDTDYADAHVLEDSEAGRSLMQSSRSSPASTIRGTPVGREVKVFRSPGGLISLQDPLYRPAEGEKEEYSGLEYARLVQRTNDFDKYKQDERAVHEVGGGAPVQTQAHHSSRGCTDWLPRRLRERRHQELPPQRGHRWGLGGPADQVRAERRLRRDPPALHPPAQPQEMKSPIRLEEYLNQVDTLRDALEESGAALEESECLHIIKSAVLASAEGRDIYGQAFVNARHGGWTMDGLLIALQSDSHELPDNIGGGAANKAGVEPSANATIAGTDGATLADMTCCKCGDKGHIARHCPTKKGAGAAVATSKTTSKAAAKAAEADADEEGKETDKESTTKERAASKEKSNSKSSAKGAAASSASTRQFFESDSEAGSSDSGEDFTSSAHLAGVEELDLLSQEEGDSARRA